MAPLGDKVRAITFNDAKHSGNDSCLLGPPSVEFAPFQKTPNGRTRKDARQSTIDQDPEFIDFLESLTTPIARSTTVDQDGESSKTKEKVTVTPLIQFLKEKKANKGKETSNTAKGSKHVRQDSKGSKTSASAGSKPTPVAASPTTKKRSAQAVKVEQAARDAVKVLSKQNGSTKPSASAASPNAKATSSSITPNVTPNSTATSALADKKRERGNASAAAKILQRDLGLAGSPGSRGGRGARGSRSGNAPVAAPTQHQAVAKTEHSMTLVSVPTKETVQAGTTPAVVSTEQKIASDTAPNPGTPATLASNAIQKSKSPPSGPAASRANPPTHPRNAHPSGTGPTTAQASKHPTTSTQAFLKHANPSQGVTEALLSTTFAQFGTVKKCEIDKKKGFAYVDFENSDGLQKAIKASPVKVAEGHVVVLERKIGGREQPGQNLGVRGGGGPRRGNRGGGGGNADIQGRGNARARGGGTSRGGAADKVVAPKAVFTETIVASSSPITAPTTLAKEAPKDAAVSFSSTAAPTSEP